MGEWQKIETAPVDTRVLLWLGPKWGMWFGNVYRFEDGDYVVRPDGCSGDFNDITTHWMPLPHPPKET